MIDKPPLDLDDALPRVDGDLDFLASLLDLFSEDFAERATRLMDALFRGDLAAASDLGHAIKGASANLGLPFIRECAARLETAAKAGDKETAKTSFVLMNREFRRLKDFLQSHPLE